MCSLGSTMALLYFGYSCKNTVSWENNIFEAILPILFRFSFSGTRNIIFGALRISQNDLDIPNLEFESKAIDFKIYLSLFGRTEKSTVKIERDIIWKENIQRAHCAVMMVKVLESKNLQLSILNGPVDAERSEPVHLRRRLPLVTQVPRSLQLNVYPAIRVWF